MVARIVPHGNDVRTTAPLECARARVAKVPEWGSCLRHNKAKRIRYLPTPRNGGRGHAAPEPRRGLPEREQGQGSGEAYDQPEREDKRSGGTVTHGAYSTHAPTVTLTP